MLILETTFVVILKAHIRNVKAHIRTILKPTFVVVLRPTIVAIFNAHIRNHMKIQITLKPHMSKVRVRPPMGGR